MKQASLGLAGTSLLPHVSRAGTPPFGQDQLALITNTVKAEMEADWQATIQLLADLGYRHIEGGPPANVSAKTYGKALQTAGLKSLGYGSSMSELQKNLKTFLQTVEHLQARYLVCYWPWLSSADNLSREETLLAADNLNKLGRSIHQAGFRLVWHNHDKEFVPLGDEQVFDLLMRETNPEWVGVELDWYWVAKGEADPIDLFQRYPGRFELAHVKDMNNNRDRGMTCVGSGILDFTSIIQHAPHGGTQLLIVENERAIRGMRCATGSIQHLKSIL